MLEDYFHDLNLGTFLRHLFHKQTKVLFATLSVLGVFVYGMWKRGTGGPVSQWCKPRKAEVKVSENQSSRASLSDHPAFPERQSKMCHLSCSDPHTPAVSWSTCKFLMPTLTLFWPLLFRIQRSCDFILSCSIITFWSIRMLQNHILFEIIKLQTMCLSLCPAKLKLSSS